jgi:hypothetical protein
MGLALRTYWCENSEPKGSQAMPKRGGRASRQKGNRTEHALVRLPLMAVNSPQEVDPMPHT